MKTARYAALIVLIALLVASPICFAESLKLIGRGSFPFEMPVGKTKVGGLSGISFDPITKTFWVISDDSAYKGGAPRAYQISLSTGGEADLKPVIRKALILRDAKGLPFPVADCEGIACTGKGAIWVSSEGRTGKNGAPPFLRMFSLTNGRMEREIPLPAAYLPADAAGKPIAIGDASQTRGVVANKSMESCSLSPNLLTVYTANEASLVQEKSAGEGEGGASVFNRTQVRISALNAKSGACLAEKLYVSDAGCLFGSISDLAALDNAGNLLVLERRVIRLQEGTGSCGIRIYRVNINQPTATDLREFPSVANKEVTPLEKTLIYDSSKEGMDDLDNVEGICVFRLPSGKTGLAAVSDDNFNSIQQTQFLLYELIP